MIMSLNYRERREGMIDHRSMYKTNAAVKLKPEKIQTLKGFEPINSEIPVQCSTN